MKKARALNPECTMDTVSLHIVGDEEMETVNQTIFNREGSTDVITLTYDSIPGDENGREGDLFINAELAIRTESSTRWSPRHELALYLAHACDHLHGAEDDTDAGRKVMIDRETAWVSEAATLGLLEMPTS